MTNFTLETNKWAVDILEANMEDYTPDERTGYLSDITQHGCQSGAVSGVIYHSECETLFKVNMAEILNTIDDLVSEGMTLNQFEEDVLNLPTYLVWAVIEYIAYEMLEQEQA